MAERAAPRPSEAKEKHRAPPEPAAAPLDASKPAVYALEPEAVDTIEAFVRSTEKDKEQKMKFLRSICTVCNTAAERNMVQGLSVFCCCNELAKNITELLAEEPRAKLCFQLWQLAMAAITALSTVKAALEEKIHLLVVCFQSILLFPSEQDLNVSLYSETLKALDRMLHTLVFVHPSASVGKELHSIFQVLLPFTCSQSAAVRQRVVGRFWKLSHSLVHFCQGRPHRSLGRTSSVRYQELHVPMLGRLVGSLLLCCAFPEDRTHFLALQALRQLYTFILGRTRKATAADRLHPSQTSHGAKRGWHCVGCCSEQPRSGTPWGRGAAPHGPALGVGAAVPLPTQCSHLTYHGLFSFPGWEARSEEQDKLKQWEADHEFSLSWTTNTTIILQSFVKHLHSWEKTDLFLVALWGMRDCSNYNTQVATTMLSILMLYFNPTADDVQRILMEIHRSRKLITEQRAQTTIEGTLSWLANSSPRAVTLSLLRCSPTCNKDTWELWEMALSLVSVVPQMVQELLQLLEIAPLDQETKTGGLPLAATTVLHKILQCRKYGAEVRLFFPELFVALIFQLVSSRELAPLEETTVNEDQFRPSAPAPAIRTVLEVMHSLLLCAELDQLVCSMDRHQLWKGLLGSATWQSGLHSLSRMMVRTCRGQCARVFSHLQKLLQNNELQWREVPAITFYMELRSCEELQEEDTCAQKIFKKYTCSKQLKSRELALHGLRGLYAGRMQLLLPDALQWLQNTRADIKVQAMQLLQDIAAQHPASMRSVLSQLATQLLCCFNEDSVEVRSCSMELFAVLLTVPGKRQLLPQAERSLLPLFIRMNEDFPSVAQAAQNALTHAAKLLGWEQLQHLASEADICKIADCLLQKGGSALEQYLQQSVQHLRSPQPRVREAAVRFLGESRPLWVPLPLIPG
ncbi:maestro heat-like repeat-containing protein family member 7 isoform X1 [Numida meleagris]|uniref:maestro heat-like repeat-containing protein family member 7 isoform X1 n=1 Tax=Numida meleagris TaxID=8996 RepID=UPI000B3DECA5|nr:maestro heat-like repeat-containing protein family member 7 isoform X1 [Numida meleagris]